MTAFAITGMALTGVLRLTWVQDNLAHVLDHSHTDETSGTWTGLACPSHGLAVGTDVDNATLQHLTADHRAFAETLAERQSLTVPSQDPGYGNLGQAFPPWPGPARDAILQPPKPEIWPSPQVLERAADRDADPEAAD